MWSLVLGADLSDADLRSADFSLANVTKRLYDLGAHRVVVTGTGPLGCVPAELAMQNRNGECLASLKYYSAYYFLDQNMRIVETADIQIKRWAAGKESNMRALLSTLQYVRDVTEHFVELTGML
ncbi:GDSL esterase/lipase [Senna tora]|uniref:GDSL esterase/lipase n=1 Tax=Senna tora TaxID=362788 RepID=A0A835CJ40_9FABA|nr:GDSL esterase/lipase [Senna tora]